MVTRNVTHTYILMRNNSLRSSDYAYCSNSSDNEINDKTSLFPKNVKGLKNNNNVIDDIELGNFSSKLPPSWVSLIDDIQYEMTKLKQKVKELVFLHESHLGRASLDDNIDEDEAIEVKTKEITTVFSHCHRLLSNVSHDIKKTSVSSLEQRMGVNVRNNIARNLQDISISFRKAQSQYLKRLQQRDERLKKFDIPLASFTQYDAGDGLTEDYTHHRSEAMTQLIADNCQSVLQREAEINQILSSLQDLNVIFRDISHMVVDQGTIVDRIDYNIEATHVRVHDGLQQLRKAEKTQKRNRKMLVILFLAFIVTILFVIYVLMKL